MTTPLEIDIALHYFTRPGDYGKNCGDNNFTAPAVQQALRNFAEIGLLRHHPGESSEYSETEGLKFYVQCLTAIPFPIQRWVNPMTGEVQR